MEKGIAVTGMGMISAIGQNLEETYNSLITGKNGLSFPEILQTKHTHLPVGEIKISNKELLDSLKLNSTQPYTRASLLGIIAVKEAIENAGLNINELKSCGFISGTSVGGMDSTEQFYNDFEKW